MICFCRDGRKIDIITQLRVIDQLLISRRKRAENHPVAMSFLKPPPYLVVCENVLFRIICVLTYVCPCGRVFTAVELKNLCCFCKIRGRTDCRRSAIGKAILVQTNKFFVPCVIRERRWETHFTGGQMACDCVIRVDRVRAIATLAAMSFVIDLAMLVGNPYGYAFASGEYLAVEHRPIMRDILNVNVGGHAGKLPKVIVAIICNHSLTGFFFLSQTLLLGFLLLAKFLLFPTLTLLLGLPTLFLSPPTLLCISTLPLFVFMYTMNSKTRLHRLVYRTMGS